MSECYEWELWIKYPGPHGWELELKEETHREACKRLREYKENVPQYPARLKRVRKDSR